VTPLERIFAAIDALGSDEREVLAVVAERLAMGRRLYGELHPATDPRDFAREALEEVADGLVYCAAALVRDRLTGADGQAPSRALEVQAPEGRQCGAERGDP
jgi:hypothetical protein